VECPKCGFAVTELDPECPRCKRIRTQQTPAPVPVVQRAPVQKWSLRHLLRLSLLAVMGLIGTFLLMALIVPLVQPSPSDTEISQTPQAVTAAEPYSYTSPAESSIPAAPPPSSPVSDTVYATRTGACYHSTGCSSLRQSQIPMSKPQAEAQGLRACSRCSP
jgi:hypothetical protein